MHISHGLASPQLPQPPQLPQLPQAGADPLSWVTRVRVATQVIGQGVEAGEVQDLTAWREAQIFVWFANAIWRAQANTIFLKVPKYFCG